MLGIAGVMGVARFMQRAFDEQVPRFVARGGAADRIAAFDHQHLAPGAREDRASRQAAKAGADHHYVIARHLTALVLSHDCSDVHCRYAAACQIGFSARVRVLYFQSDLSALQRWPLSSRASASTVCLSSLWSASSSAPGAL